MSHAEHLSSVSKSSKGASRKRIKIVGIGTAVITLLTIFVWWFFFHPYVSTDDARIAATLVRVAPMQVSGRIEQINVMEGSLVKKGDILLELDHRLTNAQVNKAKAKSELAAKELKRVEQLVQQRSLPIRELDNARANADIAAAELKLAEVADENTYLRSPIDGVVVQKIAEIGNILEAGQTALTVADIENAWVSANVEETEIGLVRLGQKVKITVDEGGVLHGKVSEIRQATASQFSLIPSDNAAGNFTKVVQRMPIKIELEKHDAQRLRAGQSVEIKIRVR